MTVKTKADPTAEARAAVDQLVAALTADIDRMFDGTPPTAPAVLASARRTLAAVAAPGLVDTVVATARAVSNTLTTAADRAKVHGTSASYAHGARARLAEVVAAADAALFVWPGQADLDAAEATLADIRHTATQRLADLEAAVGRADVDAVMRLRGAVEVGDPVAVAQAESAVLALQVDRAEALTAAPAQRREQAQAQAAAATDALRAAQDVARKATEAVDVADAALALAAGAEATAAATHNRLAALHAEAVLAAEHDQAARLRRLAGLPEPVADDDPPPAPPAWPARRVRVTGGPTTNRDGRGLSVHHN